MPQQQPGSYQGGEMMMMKSVFWWRKPEYPEETSDLRQVTITKLCSDARTTLNTATIQRPRSHTHTAQTYTYLPTYLPTYLHTYLHTYLPIPACLLFKHVLFHTYIHTYVHTYTHTYIHTYIHTYTHTGVGFYIIRVIQDLPNESSVNQLISYL